MIIARSDSNCDDWTYNDAQRNALYKLLSDTVYAESKKKHFEYLIQDNLSQAEYEAFQQQFRRDAIDPVPMKGAANMGKTWRHINQIMKDKEK